jgi:hypothetical protein
VAPSTQFLRNAWAPACSGKGGVFIPAYRALDECLRRWRYAPRRADTGAYNCRRITGGSGYSLHSYGPGDRFRFWNGVTIPTALAVDINWLTNPYGRRLRTDMPPGMVTAIEAIRTIDGVQVWRWGGRYRENKDAMHFEIICSPRELARGIRRQGPPPPPPPPKEPFTVAQYEEIIRRLDAIDARCRKLETQHGDWLEPTTVRVRELKEALEPGGDIDKNRGEPTTKRVREIHEHLGLS